MKKLILLLLSLLLFLPSFADTCDCDEKTIAIEHMFAEKNAISNQVMITNLRNIICKGNVFKIAFICKLHSEKSIAGETVNFCVPEAIYTQEGTLLIPAGSKVAGKIIKIQKPKIFNKNARVYIKFECLILPDGSTIVMNGRPNTSDGSLKEGPWMSAGKVAASTLGLGAVGAGAGVGFAFIPNPAKIGTGLAIGIPIGASVGFITGLVTPGLNYHAKAGETVNLILCDDLALCKWCENKNNGCD